jgi:glycosyltransferase involved in cell wall biosynthesis
MKVLFVNARYAPNEFGGAERTVRTLAEALVQAGHTASVVSLAHDHRASHDRINGVTAHYVPLANVFAPWESASRTRLARAAWHAIDIYNPVMGARVGTIVDREKPDVIQTGCLTGFSVSVWHEAKKRRLPVVQMLHDYYLGCGNSTMFRAGRTCPRQCGRCHAVSFVRRRSSGIPSEVISLSQRTLDKLRDCGFFRSPARSTVIRGICNHAVAAEPPERAPGPLVVGFLGRIDRTKGLETLLEATRSVVDGSLRVLVAGSGAPEYVEPLKRAAGPAVEFIGYSKPADFFAAIDVLVVPSIWEEPLGRVIYEAYVHGVPVVVSRSGGMPEIVDEGETGYIVPPGAPAALRAVLQRLAMEGNPRRHAAACVRKSQEFSVEHQFARFFEVWSRAARGFDAAA